MATDVGEIYRVAGPVVTATGISPRMYDVVYVGEEKLMGEVIGLEGQKAIIQVYESTSGVRPGEPVENSGAPLTVELGPGVITRIYDGIQRPLPILQEMQGDFISRGATAPGVPRDETWEFTPTVDAGTEVTGGEVIGTVPETEIVTHRVMVPPDVSGTIDEIHEGSYTVEDPVGHLEDGTELTMLQEWPIREQRPIDEKLLPDVPLVTGQRILDTLFPVAKGGTAAIPGPFGSGKTVTQHQLAKWADSDVVIFIGCGERGNEMTEVLEEFPELEDPQTGNPLMERTVLIANTSNMPVAAREASVYTGITIAEYYRDQGLDVSLMADSTSRWAEALREISSRLEEMPGEEGYPAYLGAELSAFYERAGRVRTLDEDEGSVTVIGAVSPPGGDFSEPVTQNTLRIVKVFWALDSDLASRRHFPAINWLDSYSLYRDGLSDWFDENVAKDFDEARQRAMQILEKESELEEIVQLVGSDALPESEQLTLDVARQIREIFLQQNAFHDVDTYTEIGLQYELLKAILRYEELADEALDQGIPVEDITSISAKTELARSKLEEDMEDRIDEVLAEMADEFDQLEQQAQTVAAEVN